MIQATVLLIVTMQIEKSISLLMKQASQSIKKQSMNGLVNLQNSMRVRKRFTFHKDGFQVLGALFMKLMLLLMKKM